MANQQIFRLCLVLLSLALTLTACGNDDMSSDNYVVLTDYTEPASEDHQPMASLQQAPAEPTAREILDGVLTATHTSISEQQKTVLAARLQQMTNTGNSSNLQMALLLTANPQIRGTVQKGMSPWLWRTRWQR